MTQPEQGLQDQINWIHQDIPLWAEVLHFALPWASLFQDTRHPECQVEVHWVEEVASLEEEEVSWEDQEALKILEYPNVMT